MTIRPSQISLALPMVHRSAGSLDNWVPVSVVSAASELGWRGEVRWPVHVNDLTFAAVCKGDEPSGPGAGWLLGCIVPSADPTSAVEDASQLAGYSARAVLVLEPDDVLDLQMQTSLLDQGAVVVDGGCAFAVNSPGDVVPSPLQIDDAWKSDERWVELQQAVLSSPVVGTAG